jgi:hypothetical protein
MNIQNVVEIMCKNDGSLPDIEFDFGLEKCVNTAYRIIQEYSNHIVSASPYYWSNSCDIDIPIIFGQNPAEIFLSGDAQSFHLVFGGIRSPSGKHIPDLGVFVMMENTISLDYRMGEDWNAEAVEGLFEIMALLKSISSTTRIEHIGNYFEYEESILMSVFNNWLVDRQLEGKINNCQSRKN